MARSPGRHGTKDPPARCLWSSCGGVGNEADQHGLPLVVPKRRWNHMRPRRCGRGYAGPAISGGRRGHRHVFHARMGGVRQKRPASALFAVVVPIMRAYFFLKSDYSHTHAACGTPTMRTARGRVLFASCVRKKNTNNTSQRMFSCIRIGCRTWRRRARKRWNCSRVRESSSTVKRCYGGFHAFASASWVRSLGFRAKRNKHCRFGEV